MFGRLFPRAPSWEPRGDTEYEKQDYIWQLVLQMIGEADRRTENQRVPSGYTYFGQFITHDLTFDASARFGEPNDVARIANLRTPRFDLDCVYGRGPSDQPDLYDPENPEKFLVGSNGYEDDLPRVIGQSADLPSLAAIADDRNDENVIISQLHLAFLKFHNRQVDRGKSFEEARDLTRWHYQWLVLHDYLPKICGERVLADIEDPSRCLELYDPDRQPFTPVEFSTAAFRFGHSVVRSRYTLNDHLGGARKIVATNPASLRGHRRLPRDWTIQWDHFVKYNGNQPQLSMAIGPAVPHELGLLPLAEEIAPGSRLKSLPYRTLLNAWKLELPSGQRVAESLNKKPLDPAGENDDPLWIYILREAANEAKGAHLGEVGALLVTSVFLGFMLRDSTAFPTIDPDWRPGGAAGGSYQLADFLKDAGMPMTSEDWDRSR